MCGLNVCILDARHASGKRATAHMSHGGEIGELKERARASFSAFVTALSL
jgi:hypothetical protein